MSTGLVMNWARPAIGNSVGAESGSPRSTSRAGSSNCSSQPRFRRTWSPATSRSRVPHDEAVFGGAGNQVMASVAAGGPGLVAVGFGESRGNEGAMVWTSPDGVTWSRVVHNEVVFGGSGSQGMRSVATGVAGLVAAGFDQSGGDQDAAVWTSPDGITWSRVPHDEVAFGGGRNQRMTSMTIEGASLVITGYDSSGGDQDAAVWIFPDGE